VVRHRRRLAGGTTSFVAGGVAGTLAGVAAKLLWDGVVDKLADSSILVSLLLIIAVIAMTVVVLNASGKVDRLIERASFSIDYYPADDADELYRRSREVIARSDSDVDIYAVNSYIEVFKESNTGSDERQQRNYLESFERRFDSVGYHRLIQVKNGQLKGDGPALADLLAPAYRDHYLAMARFAKANPEKGVKIEEVPAKLPTSFVVVKNRHGSGGQIIWQMNKHDPNAKAADVEQIMGVFIITDPDALLVPRFMQWFSELDRNSRELTEQLLLEEPAGSEAP
jgi:hypothetical protein